jgi:hypothetical protein
VVTLAPCLLDYGFSFVGMLWERRRAIFTAAPAIYAFVAPNGIADYTWVGLRNDNNGSIILGREAADPASWIQPTEVFYIGASECLRKRIHNYKSSAKMGCPLEIESNALRKASAHTGTWMLRRAYEQRAPIHVYVLHGIPYELTYIKQLPVDLLRGWEAGLIRELNPRGNREFAPVLV